MENTHRKVALLGNEHEVSGAGDCDHALGIHRAAGYDDSTGAAADGEFAVDERIPVLSDDEGV